MKTWTITFDKSYTDRRGKITDTVHKTSPADGRMAFFAPDSIRDNVYDYFDISVFEIVAKYDAQHVKGGIVSFSSTGTLLPNGTFLVERSAVAPERVLRLNMVVDGKPATYASTCRLCGVYTTIPHTNKRIVLELAEDCPPWIAVMRTNDPAVHAYIQSSPYTPKVLDALFPRNASTANVQTYIVGYPHPDVQEVQDETRRLHAAYKYWQRYPLDSVCAWITRLFGHGTAVVSIWGTNTPVVDGVLRNHVANTTRGMLGAPVFALSPKHIKCLIGMHVGTPEYRSEDIPADMPIYDAGAHVGKHVVFESAEPIVNVFRGPPDTVNKMVDFTLSPEICAVLERAGMKYLD